MTSPPHLGHTDVTVWSRGAIAMKPRRAATVVIKTRWPVRQSFHKPQAARISDDLFDKMAGVSAVVRDSLDCVAQRIRGGIEARSVARTTALQKISLRPNHGPQLRFEVRAHP